MTYDAARKQIVLFGGLERRDAPYADTWLRTARAWSQPGAFVQPSARYRAATALRSAAQARRPVRRSERDPAHVRLRRHCIERWEWDGRKWAQVTPTATRRRAPVTALDYDSNGQRAAHVRRRQRADARPRSSPSTTTCTPTTARRGRRSARRARGRPTERGAAMTFEHTRTSSSRSAARLDVDGGVNGSTHHGGPDLVLGSAGWHQNTSVPQPGPRTATTHRLRPDAQSDGHVQRQSARRLLPSTTRGSGTTRRGRASRTTTRPSAALGQPAVLQSRHGPRDAVRRLQLPTGEDLWEWNGTAWTQRTLLGDVPRALRADGRVRCCQSHDRRVRRPRYVLTNFADRQARWPREVRVRTSRRGMHSMRRSTTTTTARSAAPTTNAGRSAIRCTRRASRPAGAPCCGDGVCNGAEDCASARPIAGAVHGQMRRLPLRYRLKSHELSERLLVSLLSAAWMAARAQ